MRVRDERRLDMPRKRCLPIAAAAALAGILAGCGQGSVANDSGKLQVVAAENFWGSIAAAARRRPGRRHEHHHQPGHRPARLRADRRRRARRWRARRWRSSTGSATTPGRRSCSPPTRPAGASCSTSATCSGSRPGGNPHRWYSPGAVQQVIDADRRDYEQARPGERRLLRRRQTALRDQIGLARYRRLIATIKAQVPRRPRSAPPRASSRRSRRRSACGS